MSIRRIAFKLTRMACVCALIVAAVGASMAVLAPAALETGWGYAKHVLRAPRGSVLAIAAGDEHDPAYRVANSLKTILERSGGFSVGVLSTEGAAENLDEVTRRGAAFAVIQSGMPDATSELTAVATLGRQYLHVIVPKDSPIHEIRELAGKRVAVGPAGGGAVALTQQVFTFYALSPAAEVLKSPLEDLQGNLDAGKCDAAVVVCELYASLAGRILAGGHYRLIPLPEAEAVARNVPGVFADRIATSAYGAQWSLPVTGAAGMPTVAVNTLLVTRRGENGYVVRKVLDALYDPELVRGAKLVGFSEKLGKEGADLALHPAAERFYHRTDPVTAERFETTAFFVVALLGAAGLAYALAMQAKRTRQEWRRKHITPYFEEMLSYSDRVELANDTESLTEILRQMAATQRRAEKEWLAGRLDTEHMENLYAIYQIRSGNTFDKMAKIQVHKLREQCARIYALMANYLRREREAALAAHAAPRVEAPAARPAPSATPKPEPPKPEPPKAPPARVTATDEEVEEGLPEILLSPDDPKAG